MNARLDLYQHIRVRSVTRVGAGVRVLISDKYGTPRWINWSFDDVGTAKRRTRTVQRWRRRRTPLTYVQGNGESALVDDEQLFKSASVSTSQARGQLRTNSTFA
jgi:hypothetical protein